MFTIERLQTADRPLLIGFIEALQEYERTTTADLLPGSEICRDHADHLLSTVAERDGLILLARIGDETIGFASAWIDQDDDPLLRPDARSHALVSDIYVAEGWRRRGVGASLLRRIETEMRRRGCRRIRICAKATNRAALACYAAAGYPPYEIIFSKAID